MSWLLRLIAFFVKKTPPPEAPAPIKQELPTNETPPVEKPFPQIDLRQSIADDLVDRMSLWIGQRETHGKNRSLLIDALNNRTGARLGDPYCQTAIWCVADDLCRARGFKNPLPRTASSQSAWRQAPAKYRKNLTGKKGDFAYQRLRNDHSRGHAMMVAVDKVPGETKFFTLEANTNKAGSRDGDGFWEQTRSTDGTHEKMFLGFVDVPQWITDVNIN